MTTAEIILSAIVGVIVIFIVLAEIAGYYEAQAEIRQEREVFDRLTRLEQQLGMPDDIFSEFNRDE